MTKPKLIRRKGATLFAYADETGNTGYNLFDAAQPTFYTGTLVSDFDLQVKGTSFIEEACRSVTAMELHGNQLGFGGIEKISSLVKKFIVEHDCQFVFTQLDKGFLAATKLTDTLLDSTSNMAVSFTHYFSPIRGLLELSLIPLLTFGDRKEFWAAYEKRDCKKFGKILETLQMRVIDQVKDERTKELLSDALSWAIGHPDQVLIVKRQEWDSPNLIAFMSLVDEVRVIADEKHAREVKIHHDEQSQFGKSIQWTFDVMKDIEKVEKHSFLLTLKRRTDSSYKSPIEIISSKSSPGLQVVDIALWLIKRYSEDALPAACAGSLELTREIVERARIVRFNLETYRDKIQKAFQSIMSTELTSGQEERARAFFNEIEQRRLIRIGS